MSVSVVINQMIILFLLMGLGYLLFKLRIMNRDFNKRITKILLNVTMPAMILSSVLNETGERDTKSVFTIFIIAIAAYTILPMIGFLLVSIFPFAKEQKGLYMFMTVYSNVGFMGFPVMNALFGSTAVFYAAIFNIVFNLSIYTFGIWLMNYGKKNQLALDLKTLLNPGLLLSLLSVIIYFFNPTIPSSISSTIDYIGNLTVPLAMMVIGATLATMNIRELFNDWRIYPYTFFRQFLLPLACFPILKLLIHDTFILGISFILIMMPIANTAVLYATEYQTDEKLAAKTVFFTTVVSIVTIPLLISICF